MKKLKVSTLVLIILSTFALAGCQDRNDDDKTDVLEDRIEKLEQEISNLEKKNETAATDNTNTDNTTSPISSETIDTLTKAVDDAIARTGAEPTGSDEEKRRQFFDLKSELKKAEHKLDEYDDYLEEQYKSDKLTYDQYRGQEKLLGELEDKLDAAMSKIRIPVFFEKTVNVSGSTANFNRCIVL